MLNMENIKTNKIQITPYCNVTNSSVLLKLIHRMQQESSAGHSSKVSC